MTKTEIMMERQHTRAITQLKNACVHVSPLLSVKDRAIRRVAFNANLMDHIRSVDPAAYRLIMEAVK